MNNNLSDEINNAYIKLGLRPPPLNGGLYTGEPFKEGAEYANVPVVPDSGYIIHYALRSANPPTEALYQYPETVRPGNNTPIMPGIDKYPEYNMLCVKPHDIDKMKTNCNCRKCVNSKYYYIS